MRIRKARRSYQGVALTVFLLLLFALTIFNYHLGKDSHAENSVSFDGNNLQNGSSRKYHLRSQESNLESRSSFKAMTRSPGIPANPQRGRKITDHSLFLTELRSIDSAVFPEDYIDLQSFFFARVSSAEDFGSPYYEEICSRLLFVVTSWLVNESGWAEDKVIDFIGNVCENLQRSERDSKDILNIYIRRLSFIVLESEGLKRQVLAARINPNQAWLANLQGTVFAHDITKNHVPEDRIYAISDIEDSQTRAYTERAVLNDLADEDVGLARLFYLSEKSIIVRDQLLVKKLFPDPDDETLNMIMNSQNESHRDWALSSLAVKKFYLNDLNGANFLVDRIYDKELRNEALRNLKAAKSRREQLKNLIPSGAPPGILE